MFKTDTKGIDTTALNKMVKVAARLKKISGAEFSGWADFVLILDGYCNSLLDHKRNFNIAMASDEQIAMLKLYDRDVWLINNFIKKIPETYVKNLENELKRQREEDEFNKSMEE